MPRALRGCCKKRAMNTPIACTIRPAQEHEKEAILALYDAMRGGAADWDAHYPTMVHIDEDMARGNLFVMTEGEGQRLIATISIDEDEVVAALPNWSPELEPAGELSRLCVREDCRNRGIAREMMAHAFAELRRRGCKGVHILIREGHIVATRSYMRLGYRPAGTCQLFGKSFDCYEMPL